MTTGVEIVEEMMEVMITPTTLLELWSFTAVGEVAAGEEEGATTNSWWICWKKDFSC